MSHFILIPPDGPAVLAHREHDEPPPISEPRLSLRVTDTGGTFTWCTLADQPRNERAEAALLAVVPDMHILFAGPVAAEGLTSTEMTEVLKVLG